MAAAERRPRRAGGAAGAIDFSGRAVLVTGAGRGIGRAHALLLASRGAAVVVNDVGSGVGGSGASAEPARQVVAEIGAAGGRALASTHDVADPAAAADAVAAAVDAFGRLDAVVNNAGILDHGSFPDVGADVLERQVAVHLGGSFNVTRAAWPHLRAAGAGRVVMTTSPSGLYAGPGQVAYSAAKAGVVGLTRSLAAVGAADGIRVNAVAPGGYSRMTESGGGDEAFRRFTARHRTAEQVAPLVALLAHERCPSNGEILVASGGRVARVLIAETVGLVQPGHTPEDLLRAWDAVVDDGGCTVPASTAAALAFGLEQLRRAGVPVPATAFDGSRL